MIILLTNDDGIFAPALVALREALAPLGNAPMSGAAVRST